MKINEYFDKIVCINLDKRKDRWAECQVQFKRHGLNVERISAIEGNPMGWKPYNKSFEGKMHSFEGNMGCIASHIKIYEMAIKNGWKNVLIVEDDCDFIENLNEIFERVINDVPEDWDLLYFGGVHETRGGKFIPEKLTNDLVIAKRIITTTCYAIKDSCYQFAIDTIKQNHPYYHTAIDGFLGAGVQPHKKTIAFHPPVAWQRSSFSDIQGADRDYSDMMKNNNMK